MGKRLFVGNVDPRVTEDQLQRFFSRAGEVVEVSIPRDRATAERRGFAFVEFADEEQADRALEIFDAALLEGRRIRPRVAFEQSARESGKRHRDRPRARGADLGVDEPDLSFDGSSGPDADYSSGRARGKPRRHGKHGCDRKRGQGTRRVIE